MKDIEEINKLPIEEQIEAKMEVINSFNKPNEVSYDYLPETHTDKYFFISYSQRDFKKVYLDLFHLDQHDVHFWYDRDNPGGKTWPDFVRNMVGPFQCKGVIFYISENSLTSPSVDNEMKIIQELGKAYIPIAMPFESDYLYKGESVKGKEYPVSEMIDILFENGKIDQKKAKRLHKYFSAGTLYIHLSMPDVSKAEKIKLSIPIIPLLVGKCLTEGYLYKLYIEKINDNSVDKITKLDFVELLTHLKRNVDNYYDIIFCPSCLANCRHLKTIEIPKKFNIERIEMHAFANDDNFVKFIGVKKLKCEILDGAFYNCSSFKMDIVFPSRIERIGSYAFYNCSSLPDFELPKKLKTIGEYAFCGCSKFSMIKIPELVARIEEGAYEGCTNVAAVLIGEGVTYIGSRAFYGCSSLRGVELNDYINYIGYDAFLGCDSLEFYEKGNVKYLGNMGDHYIFAYGVTSKDKKISGLERCRLINHSAFEECNFYRTKVVIPDSCIFIGDSAFSCCSNLKEVYLPNSLISMGRSVFERCRNLCKVVWPNSLTVVPEETFSECNALYDFEFGDNSSLISIERRAFSGCLSLYELKLPDSVVSIKEEAFYFCGQLSNFVLPSQLQCIEKKAFTDCRMPRNITIPSSVARIGELAFSECSGLKEITYPKPIEAWKAINKIWCSFINYENDEPVDKIDIWANYGSVEVIHCTDGDLRRDDVLDDCYSDILKLDYEGGTVELEKVGYVRYQNRDFILVRPLDEELPEGAAYTLEVIAINGVREYYTIFNKALLDKIFNKFAKDLEKKNKNSN